MVVDKIKKYKQAKGSSTGQELYKEILLDILDNFKNLMNLLRSSIIVNLFVEIEDIHKINFMSPIDVKKLFRVGEVNLLQYHKLVLENLDCKDKIIKVLCNKILIACRLDLYGKGKFVDLYTEIENKLNEEQDENMREIIKISKEKNTIRGGLKKRKKQKRVL